VLLLTKRYEELRKVPTKPGLFAYIPHPQPLSSGDGADRVDEKDYEEKEKIMMKQ